jgi:hypothetical protein
MPRKKKPGPGAKPNAPGTQRYRKATQAARELADIEKVWWMERMRQAKGSMRRCGRDMNLARTSILRHLRRVGITKEDSDALYREYHPLRRVERHTIELECAIMWGPPKGPGGRYGRRTLLFEGKGGWERNALLAIACRRRWREMVDEPIWIRLWDRSKVGPFILRLSSEGLYFEKRQ